VVTQLDVKERRRLGPLRHGRHLCIGGALGFRDRGWQLVG
jgi:hypothetical protein